MVVVLAVAGVGRLEGELVGAGRQWQLGTRATITSGGRCLAPVGSGTANGTKLTLTTCSGTAAQRWAPTA
ncbi:RICIN domain-containing protein [Streptomyces sp. NRRL B-24572]|uniref:RICIN domain-containing protein n=1 Tax=Streptomyces sp. NRRL B-24572 TaxID=1962156 RepID=UPI000A3B9809|nr:RICIN domain-containing protein [Streptomyces sp. NRRL B-24572]